MGLGGATGASEECVPVAQPGRLRKSSKEVTARFVVEQHDHDLRPS